MISSVIILVLIVLISNIVANEVRVTCIGDSITAGNTSCLSSSYTVNLQTILGNEYIVTNAGKSSMTMLREGLCHDGSSEKCSYWDTEEMQIAFSSQPHIVTIMLGTNDGKYFNWEGVQDTGDYYVLDYIDMIQRLKKLNPMPKVYVMIPPPIWIDGVFGMSATIINITLPNVLRNMSDVIKSDVDGVIDIHTAIISSNLPSDVLTCDGCHPKKITNQIIAQTIADAITKI